MSAGTQDGTAKRRPGRPRKDATSPDVARVEDMAPPVPAEQVMQERRAEEYPSLAAQNADEPNTDNTGRPEAQTGKVLIQAETKDDLHLGDERVIYGRGNGVHGEIDPDERAPYEYPSRAYVTAETANALVKAGLAKRV